MRAPDFERGQALESSFGQRRLLRCITPFYLDLMGFSAAGAGPELVARVRRRSRGLSGGDIEALLGMHWRPRCMGAWYAIAANDERLSSAVHESLETSLGHLTSPPLITAILAYPRADSAELLRDYAKHDFENQWGAADFALAALKRLEPRTPQVPGEGDADANEILERLISFGESLQGR